MYCSQCGTKLTSKLKFCSNCGKNTSDNVKIKETADITKKDFKNSSPFITVASIFIPVFLVVMVVNQFFYGGCFKSYCLAAAFPKVTLIAAVLTWILYANSKD